MPTQVVSIFDGQYDAHIARAVEKLHAARLVVIPTETVYGATGLLNHSAAVAALRELRTGSAEAAFTIHIASPEQAFDYLGPVSELGRRCIHKLWPGPVALIFDVPEQRRREIAAKLGAAETDLFTDGTIALRCPDHPVARDISAAAKGPVAAVRAGQSFDAAAIAQELDGRIDLILDAGPPRFSKPSTIVRIKDDAYEIIRVGIYDQRIIEKLLRTTILFVCSGNTCRSPMAEAITRHMLAEKLAVSEEELEKRGVAVVSAGAMAMPGARATPAAVTAVSSLGADLSRHRSRMLTPELIHQADLIFTMGENHAKMVAAMVPSATIKTATLNPEGDIEDPIGGDTTLYEQLAGELQTFIEKRLDESVLPQVRG